MNRLKTLVIPPSGPEDAKIAFFGEAPGANEKTKPFEGTVGQFFNKSLRQKGISRAAVYTDNIFEQQPPRNNFDYFFQDKGRNIPTWEGQEHIDRLKKAGIALAASGPMITSFHSEVSSISARKMGRSPGMINLRCFTFSATFCSFRVRTTFSAEILSPA